LGALASGDLVMQVSDSWMLALWLLVVLLALLGKPLFAVLGSVAILFHIQAGLSLEVIFAEMATIVDQPIFVTIPLFVLAGTLLAESNAPVRLVGLARALLGWLPGGLAIVATCCCAFFTAVTGASGVTIIALGGLLYPVLQEDDYPEQFSLGLLTTGGSLGLLFVPSLPIIVYGLIAGVDIDTLFVAGLIPGLLLVLVISLYSVYVGKRMKVPTQAPPWRDLKGLARAAGGAALEAPIPFLIIAGIYSGTITAIEASAMTAIYVLIVEVVIYRDVKLRDLPRVMTKTAVLIGAIMTILGMAMGVKNYLVDAQVPQQILAAMSTHMESPIAFLLVLNVFLLVVGCLLDIFSATLVVVPLIAPLAIQFGVDPVHLGILFLTNLEIGYLTPPVGINLFMGSLRFDKPVTKIIASIVPFFGLLLICLIAITFVPALSTGLVDVLFGAPAIVSGEKLGIGEAKETFEQLQSRDGRRVRHGVYRATHADGSLKEEGSYNQGNKHGRWVTYAPEGYIVAEAEYRFGRQHGPYVSYFERDVKEREGTYRNDKKHGIWTEYTEDGVPFPARRPLPGVLGRRQAGRRGRLRPGQAARGLEELGRGRECAARQGLEPRRRGRWRVAASELGLQFTLSGRPLCWAPSESRNGAARCAHSWGDS
jgi:tripartite ATP-independent transporter DctM subunit